MKITVGIIIALAACGILFTLWYQKFRPIPPEGVQCFRNTKRVAVRPGKDGWGKGGYQVVQFIKDKSGEISAPILLVVRPNFRGFMGDIRHDPIWEGTFHHLGERQAKLDIPMNDEIDELLILVRVLPSVDMAPDGPWRVWTVKAIQIGDEIEIPEFNSLDLYSDRKDFGDLLELYRRANEFEMVLTSSRSHEPRSSR